MNKGSGNRWKNVKLNLNQNEKKNEQKNEIPKPDVPDKKATSLLNSVVNLSKEKGKYYIQ